MRPRKEIEQGFNLYQPSENGDAYKAFMRQGVMLQVLLDIRDLLATPPVENIERPIPVLTTGDIELLQKEGV